MLADRQTDMTKLIVAFWNFVNAPKNVCVLLRLYQWLIYIYIYIYIPPHLMVLHVVCFQICIYTYTHTPFPVFPHFWSKNNCHDFWSGPHKTWPSETYLCIYHISKVLNFSSVINTQMANTVDLRFKLYSCIIDF
jgi:hypothetical protein